MTLRFDVSPEGSAKIAVHAALAATALFEFEEMVAHHTRIADSTLNRLGGSERSDLERMLARSNRDALYDQWWSLRRDLTELVADAYEKGSDNLRRMTPLVKPKPDLTLTEPDVNDPKMLILTMHVMVEAQTRKLRTAGDEVRKILPLLKSSSDGPTRELGSRCETFLSQISKATAGRADPQDP